MMDGMMDGYPWENVLRGESACSLIQFSASEGWWQREECSRVVLALPSFPVSLWFFVVVLFFFPSAFFELVGSVREHERIELDCRGVSWIFPPFSLSFLPYILTVLGVYSLTH